MCKAIWSECNDVFLMADHALVAFCIFFINTVAYIQPPTDHALVEFCIFYSHSKLHTTTTNIYIGLYSRFKLTTSKLKDRVTSILNLNSQP